MLASPHLRPRTGVFLMPDNELKGHHIMLFRGDFDRLKDFHPELSPTIVIRNIVRDHIKRMEAKGPAAIEQLKELL
jgi:hypothetical protein